jgi:hypothetical protein
VKVARNERLGNAMVFASMDFGSVCFFWIFILFGLPALAGAIGKWSEEREAKKQAQAQEKFKRENPELWRQQELLKLEKERLEAQQKLAQEERNVGLLVGIGRGLGWW